MSAMCCWELSGRRTVECRRWFSGLPAMRGLRFLTFLPVLHSRGNPNPFQPKHLQKTCKFYLTDIVFYAIYECALRLHKRLFSPAPPRRLTVLHLPFASPPRCSLCAAPHSPSLCLIVFS